MLVAVAQCFESSSAKVSAEDALAEDRSHYRLIYHILSNHSAEYRPAFSMIFDLLGKIVTAAGPGRPILARNEAANGLLEALLFRLDLYRVNVIEAIQPGSSEASQQSRDLRGLYVTTAFCSVALLDSLAQEAGARQVLASHPSLVHTLVRILSHTTGIVDIEELVWDVLDRIAHNEVSVGPNAGRLSQWLAQAIVSRGAAIREDDCTNRANFFARRGLAVLNGFACRFDERSDAARALLDMVAKILGREGCGVMPEHFVQADFLSYTLVKHCGWQARTHAAFITSLIWQMSRAVTPTYGAAGLVMLHRLQPLTEFSNEFMEVIQNLTPNMLDVVREILTDYFAGTESPGPTPIGSNTVFDEMVLAEGHGDI